VALEENGARLCEAAATMLHERWPEKYSFKETESRRNSDAQILAIKNVRRAAEGKPALTPPAPVTIPRADQGKADPLLKALRDAGTAGAITAALDKLTDELGLSALPWVSERLDALPENSPERARWRKAAQILACVVRDVNVDAKDLHLTKCRELQEINGRALTPQSLERLLIALYRATPKEVTGFKLSAYRDDDGTGFVLTVSARKEKSSGSNDWWSLFYAGNQFQAVGDGNRGYYGTDSPGDSKEDFEELRNAFEKATSDWKRPAYLGYQVTRQRR